MARDGAAVPPKGELQATDYRPNYEVEAIHQHGDRWDIENGYKSIKRFMAATTSKDFVLLFYFACLLYSICRTVDLLVQVTLTGKYTRSPMLTANTDLTLLTKQTGIR